jgi:glyoxylase-like metal-dependent hydrolase (beta-lactamase superfamily II)
MFDQIGEGVFRRRYQSLDLNIGVVLGEDGVLLVDTRGTSREADELVAELRTLTDLPVRWVVNTHWHWDHTFGNSRFSSAEIWGHELCRVGLEQHGDEMRESAIEWMGPRHRDEIVETEILAPENTFAESASLEIGRRVVLGYHGFGHTDADILVDIPDADVVFMGDLVEESAPPAFGDSHPIDWPITLEVASSNARGVVVPGHGEVVDPAFVRSQQEELAAVADVATAFIRGELDLEEAIQGGPYPVATMRTAMLRAQATRG